MLSKNKQTELIEWLMTNTSLPARVQGELAAFRHGLAVAVTALSQRADVVAQDERPPNQTEIPEDGHVGEQSPNS